MMVIRFFREAAFRVIVMNWLDSEIRFWSMKILMVLTEVYMKLEKSIHWNDNSIRKNRMERVKQIADFQRVAESFTILARETDRLCICTAMLFNQEVKMNGKKVMKLTKKWMEAREKILHGILKLKWSGIKVSRMESLMNYEVIEQLEMACTVEDVYDILNEIYIERMGVASSIKEKYM